jgi:thiamine-phosphate diphosphorylase / hydroxyethylthiazole kinase
MTGKTDWISDGRTTISLSNGHKLLGDITGSGCIVGTSIASFCAVANKEARGRDGDVEAGRLVSTSMLLGAVAG